jgi:predicted RNA-binding protein with PIN domain
MRILVVDGYNALHAWPEAAPLMQRRDLEGARDLLVRRLSVLAARDGIAVTVVFDSHSAPYGQPPRKIDGVTVLFGSKRASADHVIEKLAYDAAQRGEHEGMVVATSDRLQRNMVGAMGVATMSATTLAQDLQAAISATTDDLQRRVDSARRGSRLEEGLDPDLRAALERMRRGEPEPPPG